MEQGPLPGIEQEGVQVVDQEHAAERRLFEEMLGDLPFGNVYLALLDEGWYWRDAAYIAWKGMPRRVRAPATITELADLLGCSARTIQSRRQRNPAIELRAAKVAAGLVLEKIDEVLDALMESAADPNYKNHPDRKLALEMAGVYVPKQGLVLEDGRGTDDLSDLDEDELLRMGRLKELTAGDDE